MSPAEDARTSWQRRTRIGTMRADRQSSSGTSTSRTPADDRISGDRDLQRQSLILRFFDPVQQAADSRGRRLVDILSWSDMDLEYCHDYIQMLFPLPEGSIFNSLAPVVTREVYEAFRSDHSLQESQRRAFKRILRFYGLRLITSTPASDATISGVSGSICIVSGDNFQANSGNWITRFGHNHLRITRIIRSLRVLGLEDEAQAFFRLLMHPYIVEQVSERSVTFWCRAAGRPLHIPPDASDEEREGITWLREVESTHVESAKEEDSGLSAS